MTGAEPEEGRVEPLSGLRRTAARRMQQAWAAPVFHLTREVGMAEASRVKAVVPGATVTDVLIRAAARALIAVPEVNVHVAEDSVTAFAHAGVGIAVAAPRGLTVPVVHRADALSLAEIAARRADVVARAREGGLVREDITGGTFTISNLGMMGVQQFDAILNVPQAAILAVGATVDRQRIVDGEPRWVRLASLTLTCDHRALDGAAGARFLDALAQEIERPVEG